MPGSLIEITSTEKIVGHSARESSEREKNSLMEKNGAIERPSSGEESQRYRCVGNYDPFRRKLEIEECGKRGRSEIGEKRIKTEAVVTRGVFFLRGKLRVDEKENQDERDDGDHAVAQKDARIASGKVRKENAGEGGGEGDVGLIAELRDFAEQSVFEKDEGKCSEANGDAERPQFMPEKQRDDQRCGPGIDVVEVAGAPLLGHADEARHGVENYGDDREREETNAETVPGVLDVHVDADARSMVSAARA